MRHHSSSSLFPYTTLYRSIRRPAAGESATSIVGESRLYNQASVRILLSDSVANLDRKSTRLNSSHITMSYAVFCLKKKMSDAKGLLQKLNTCLKPTP